MIRKIEFVFLISMLVGKFSIAQSGHLDSCRVYARNLFSESLFHIDPEYLMLTADTSFLLSKEDAHKVFYICIRQFKIENNLKKNLNRYRVDSRIVLAFYYKGGQDIIQFSNGLISFNDAVYSYDTKLLSKIIDIVPELNRFMK